MKTTILAVTIVSGLAAASGALGQVRLVAITDNRAGNQSVLAAPGGDARESGYSVNPGENDYDPINFDMTETDQNGSCGTAMSRIDHHSSFPGINQSTQATRAFVSNSATSASVQVSCGGGPQIRASYSENTSVSLRVEGLGGGQTLPLRFVGARAVGGGAAARVRLFANGSVLYDTNSNASINTVFNAVNGQYRVQIENAATLVRSTVGATSATSSFQAGLTRCVADVNLDGELNVGDFLSYLDLYSAGGPAADYNRDGAVNVQDLLAFMSAYSVGCP